MNRELTIEEENGGVWDSELNQYFFSKESQHVDQKGIKRVFEKYFRHVKFDNKFFLKIARFRISWATKNTDTIEFLGGNLLGVNPIRFSALDEETFFMDVLGVDKDELKIELHAIDGIDPNRIVTSNVFYLTCSYLFHGFTMSKDIGKSMESALRETYYIFAYRAMSSLVSHYFKYEVERPIAIAVYEQLSNKFLIKKLGTWQKVFEYRAEAVIPPKGLHAKRIRTYETDDAMRIVMDLQGRIRETVKNIYPILMEVRNNNEKIKNTSLDKIDIEGDSAIADIVDRPDLYAIYIKGIIYKYNDFVKSDLIHVVTDMLNMTSTKDITETLMYISEISMSDIKRVEMIVDSSINVAIEYLSRKNIQSSYQTDVMQILFLLKNYYTGSRVNNKDMDKIKNALRDIYKEATGKKNKTAVSNVRVGIMLYIVLRALAKNSYN